MGPTDTDARVEINVWTRALKQLSVRPSPDADIRWHNNRVRVQELCVCVAGIARLASAEKLIYLPRTDKAVIIFGTSGQNQQRETLR